MFCFKQVFFGLVVGFFLSASVWAKTPVGRGPCKTASQCAGGVCVDINDESYCSSTCGSCPSGMYCDSQLFAVAGLKVCVKGGASQPVQPKEPPRIPCASDRECKNGLVCAQFMGQRDCTRACQMPSECEAPSVMGMKMDFLTCSVDESSSSRKACLPKKECLANPMSCMFTNAGGLGGMIGAVEQMGASMEAQTQHAPAPVAAPGAAPSVAKASVVVVKEEPGPQAAPAAQHKGPAMQPAAFAKLLTQVKEIHFSSEQMSTVKLAAKRNYFTCKQVKELLQAFSFSTDQIKTLGVLAPRIVDMQNSHVVLDAFEFSHDREQASELLSGDGDEDIQQNPQPASDTDEE
jgi:hypothetical protein